MKEYVIGVFEEKRDYLYREFYLCEHMGILHTEKDPRKATVVGEEYKPWMDNVCEYLNRYYPDLCFSVLLLNDGQKAHGSVATDAP